MSKALGLCMAALIFSVNALSAEYCWDSDGCTRVTGVGHGAVNAGDSTTFNQRQLMAIRAAKLDALRSLAEQVREFRLQSQSNTIASSLVDDRVETNIDTKLRGIRYVKVEPIQPGIYQAVAEMDIYHR
jgi:hypothetical protein